MDQKIGDEEAAEDKKEINAQVSITKYVCFNKMICFRPFDVVIVGVKAVIEKNREETEESQTVQILKIDSFLH